jgi:hypothetical protein
MDSASTILAQDPAGRNGSPPQLPPPELLELLDFIPVEEAPEPWAPARTCCCAHPIGIADTWHGPTVWVRCVLCGHDVEGAAA